LKIHTYIGFGIGKVYSQEFRLIEFTKIYVELRIEPVAAVD